MAVKMVTNSIFIRKGKRIQAIKNHHKIYYFLYNLLSYSEIKNHNKYIIF